MLWHKRLFESPTAGIPGMDSSCWFGEKHAEVALLFCSACAMNSRDFLPWRFRQVHVV